MVRRYAEGTDVPVSRSRGEITGILTSHGCERMAWGTEPEGDTLQFVLGGRRYAFRIEKPTVEEMRERYRTEGRDWSRVYDVAARVEAEWRRRWRAHVLLIKAKLEFVAAGDSTLEREFMSQLLLADGRTMEQAVLDQSLPLRLAAGGG